MQGAGLSSKQIALCDDFIYVAQYGAGTASLNVSTAAAIVLHHFALWAAYPEQAREDQKFHVAEKPLKAHATGNPPEADVVQHCARRLFCLQPSCHASADAVCMDQMHTSD